MIYKLMALLFLVLFYSRHHSSDISVVFPLWSCTAIPDLLKLIEFPQNSHVLPSL